MRKRSLCSSSVSRFRGSLPVIFMCFCLVIPVSAMGADKLIVKNGSGTTTFKVGDNGSITSASRLLSNGALALGSAPLVLGQNLENRGIIITDKAASNQKNIYFGWNVGTSHDYAEIFALQEGVAYKNLVLIPKGGNLGIGTTNPDFLIDTGGAYCNGNTWVNASSREYKKEIKELTGDEAMTALKGLSPVKFRFKKRPDESRVGFIAEDVPELVAMKDRKGMSSMDVVAVLSKVVQEQQKTICELSEKVAELQGQMKFKNMP